MKTPKGLVLVILGLIALLASLLTPSILLDNVVNIVVASVTALVIDYLVGRFYDKKRGFSNGGVITAWIVAMVLSSVTPWYVVMATTAIAVASKHILRVKRKPIFNPAAVGLLISTYLFSSMQSWWAAMTLLPNATLIILAIALVIIAKRVKKIPQVLAFLASYLVIVAFFLLFKQTSMDALFALENPMANSALFLAAFMLTDPPTSPSKPKAQIAFGIITGTVSLLTYLILPGELVYLFIGLLVANGLHFLKTQVYDRRHQLWSGERYAPSTRS